jgi:hypothetical protein
VASGRLTAESMPELTYPLERAQAFAKQARARAGDAPPASLAAFETLVDRYRAFVERSTACGREQRGADARAALERPLTAVRRRGRGRARRRCATRDDGCLGRGMFPVEALRAARNGVRSGAVPVAFDTLV